MRRFLVITNPASGSGKALDRARKASRMLERQGHDTLTVQTSKDQPLALRLAAENLSGMTDLLVVGGDGTLNAAINASQAQWPLSIVPAGTGNDFIKNINIGSSMSDYIDTAVNGKLLPIDIGDCNGRLFLNGVGIGFDGQVVKDMLYRRSFFNGHLAYYANVLRILSTYREQRIGLAGDDFRESDDLFLATIGNGTTFGGGFRLTPNATIIDGKLDVCIIRKTPAWKRFAQIHQLNRGTHLRLPEVSTYKASRITVEGDRSVAAHIDGEYLGHPPFEISVKPAGCQLRVRREA